MSDLLADHFKPEPVEYSCEKCECKTATIQHKIKSLPKVMIIHLKRFGMDWNTMSMLKRTDKVKLTQELDLAQWCLSKLDVVNSEFELRCIINHLGDGAMKGHYVADVYDTALQQWRTYDDAVMERCSERDMASERQSTCYLLAYVNSDRN